MELKLFFSLDLSILYSITKAKSFQKACETKRRNGISLKESHYVYFYIGYRSQLSLLQQLSSPYLFQKMSSQYRAQ